MAKLDVINLKGDKVKEITLSEEIFGVTPNEDAMSKAVRLELASKRRGTHKAKTRGEVSGGGRKPWRQKGTGRARHGSIRSPIWVGGGVIFAKTPRNYTFKMNKKERKLALKSALSLKVNDKSLLVSENFDLKTSKTKDLVNILKGLKLEDKKVLFVTNSDSDNLALSLRNLPKVNLCSYNNVSIYNLLNNQTVLFEESAIKKIEEVLK